MINKKLFEMRELAKEELKHIPRGSLNQNLFRQAYFSCRMNSLGKKAKYPNDPKRVFKSVLEEFQKEYSGFIPTYNKEFFKDCKKEEKNDK